MILVLLFNLFVLSTDSTTHFDVESRIMVSDFQSTPFWMRSLEYGSVPMTNPEIGLRMKSKSQYQPSKFYDWKYGIEVNLWKGLQNEIYLTEAYLAARRGKWEIWAGRRKEIYGLGDTTLSSGFYAWSGNALPLPKIQLGTPGYLNFFKKWVGVQMTYSHGKFDNQGALNNVFLHQKSLYMRLGKPSSRLNLFGGLNHQVQWGGQRKVPLLGKRAINVYPSSLNTYFYVVTVLKNRSLVNLDSNTSSDDTENQFGNHMGSIDLAARYRTSWGSILFYKQTAYEQGGIFTLYPADDGLTGISFQQDGMHYIDGLLIEHLYTGNQNSYQSWIAKIFNTVDSHNGERIAYMYNGARSTGWWYKQDEIGSPLFMRDSKTIQGGNEFTFNAVNVIYIGLRGHFSLKTDWLFRGSVSTHTFLRKSAINPPIYGQQSYLFHVQHVKDKRISYAFDIAYDQGERLMGSLGLMAMLHYRIK
jgi:hypothetical protein